MVEHISAYSILRHIPHSTLPFDNPAAPTMSTESLVLGRSKRSTAGNRLRALLDKAHTIDAEEGFEEVEDDVDFEDNCQYIPSLPCIRL
jgi:hypothetical protein